MAPVSIDITITDADGTRYVASAAFTAVPPAPAPEPTPEPEPEPEPLPPITGDHGYFDALSARPEHQRPES